MRLTWQIARQHKMNISHSVQDNCSCYTGVDGPIAPEATYRNRFTPNSLTQLTWSHPATGRLLFEAGTTIIRNGISFTQESMGVSPDDISILELSTGYRYDSRQSGLGITSYNYAGRLHRSDQVNARVAASYVTGSHAFKVGTQIQVGEQTTHAEVNRAIDYTFRDGVPQSLRLWASPPTLTSQVRPNLGLYAQDQWTVRKLTLNVGIRFDYLHASVPAQTSDAGRFVPERTFGVVDDVPNWKDVPVTDGMLRRPRPENWISFRNGYQLWGYSSLNQINAENVGQLRLVWSRAMQEGPQEVEPYVYNGIMFLLHAEDILQALDATTGDCCGSTGAGSRQISASSRERCSLSQHRALRR